MRDWLNSVLGQDGGRVAQFALALIAVILLILLLAWIVRRMQPGARLIAAAGGKSRKRLGVIEASDVDARRRLVLVRRDEVEHLIMIGGPNDVLIESRILRSGHAVNRPAGQQIQRPISEAERPLPAAATATPGPQQVQAAATPTPVQTAPVAPRVAFDEEPTLVVARSASASAPTQAPTAPGLPPPFVPPVSRPVIQANVAMTPPTAAPLPAASAPSVATADPRRPSLTDLLAAAQASKSAAPPLKQPITAPPPPPRVRPSLPDLEDDDREVPTQVIPHRPQPAPAPAVTHPPLVEPANRETEVATQIERALSDLQLPLSAPEPAPIAERAVPAAQPVRRPPQPSATVLNAPVRPAPAFVPPTMPPIPQRPTVANLTAPAPRLVPERPPLPERPEFAATPPARQPGASSDDGTDTRAEVVPPPVQPEPVTAPRPITAPVVRPQPAAVAPTSAPQVVAPKSKNDELEEEMAKLLSELGGPSGR